MRSAGLSKQKSAYLKDLAAKTSSGIGRFCASAGTAGRRSGRASDPGERYWGVDGADVSDVHTEARECSADRRLRDSHGHVTNTISIDRARRQRRLRGGKKKGRKRKIKLPSPEQMEKIAKRWEPYRSVACWYLWKSLDTKTL